jgi:hypothetical protein
MGDAAADRTAAPGLEMSDMGQRGAQQRRHFAEHRPFQKLRLRRRRTDLDLAVCFADIGERVQARDIDQRIGLHEAEIHHRQK